MGVPANIGERQLNPLSGWFDEAALDYSAKLASSITDVIPAGRCVTVNSDGDFKLGCAGAEMPMWLWQGSEDADVYNVGYPTPAGQFMHQPVVPVGDMSALVATGGYELQTTEYDTELTYSYNQLLKSDNDGVLTNASVNGNTKIVAVVSRPPAAATPSSPMMLSFWPVWHLPNNA